MKKNKSANEKKSHHKNPLPSEISPDQKERNENAHEQADKDIAKDAEFSAHSKNDDLDEGETARLGENKTDLV